MTTTTPPDPLDRIPKPMRPLARPLIGRADLGERLARMALVFPDRFKREDRERVARDAAPGNYRVRVLTQWIDRRQAPLWYFSIIDDAARNQVYADALAHHIEPGMTALPEMNPGQESRLDHEPEP